MKKKEEERSADDVIRDLRKTLNEFVEVVDEFKKKFQPSDTKTWEKEDRNGKEAK